MFLSCRKLMASSEAAFILVVELIHYFITIKMNKNQFDSPLIIDGAIDVHREYDEPIEYPSA